MLSRQALWDSNSNTNSPSNINTNCNCNNSYNSASNSNIVMHHPQNTNVFAFATGLGIFLYNLGQLGESSGNTGPVYPCNSGLCVASKTGLLGLGFLKGINRFTRVLVWTRQAGLCSLMKPKGSMKVYNIYFGPRGLPNNYFGPQSYTYSYMDLLGIVTKTTSIQADVRFWAQMEGYSTVLKVPKRPGAVVIQKALGSLK